LYILLSRGDDMYKKVFLYGATAVLAVLAALAVTAVFTIMTIRGSGMEPALYDGDKVLINKVVDADSVGDIVAFRSSVYGEEGEGSILVRRVAGSPGDTVEIKDDMFYLNGRPYDEYMKEAVSMDDMPEVKLKDGELFVLGDNRSTSMDSRNEAIGVLKVEDRVGKVVLKWKGLT